MIKKSMPTHWIVYAFTRYQDGHEEHVYLHTTLESALKQINDGLNRTHTSDQTSYNLFELGPEIPLQFDKEIVEQPPPPPKETTIVTLRKRTKQV